ncbi:hypothetical protein L228DRAFT_271104 [Xylona heveae TC161]|uniref:Translation machinery associated TMA7 n=1 Tax=Xylona heveae (strain CBS 132557 / TC161) TaxID=1328760 RepID=A0A165A0L7_XYLHT|nr:hypothetical protein L228DRAFT_271104 [Xylona heveae TC161]KZF19784.1 hypothetical protein L228DRAFT_271104 [Xylona heveae TC161]
MGGSSREGGKVKPLKQPKKDKKDVDDEDRAHQEKLRADAKARKDMADALKKGKKK